MSAPAKRPATYEDLARVPSTMVAEIVNGELIASPRPAGPHTRAASVLSGDLGGPFDRGRGGPGGWWISYEPELHLDSHVLVPDLAGWKRGRLVVYPEAVGITLAPNWLCEVLSPRTRSLDRVRKLPIYLEHGVEYVWLVDPEARTLEVLRHGDGRWTLAAAFEGGASVRAEPFDAIELDLGALWDRGEPSAG